MSWRWLPARLLRAQTAKRKHNKENNEQPLHRIHDSFQNVSQACSSGGADAHTKQFTVIRVIALWVVVAGLYTGKSGSETSAQERFKKQSTGLMPATTRNKDTELDGAASVRGVPQQHGIRFRMPALEGDLRTVRRKRKLPDSLRREMRELAVRRAI